SRAAVPARALVVDDRQQAGHGSPSVGRGLVVAGDTAHPAGR
ncbi:hypothetical protein HMPREF9057_03056, partial [Actinomyces sp. oral taxon 171 str. F0337]